MRGESVPGSGVDGERAGDLLADRYGRSRRSARTIRRLLAGAAFLCAALFVGWLVLINGAGSRPSVNATDTAHSIIDAHEVSVSFRVATDADRPVACAVQALDDSFAIVGWKVVEYPASARPERAFTETVRTVRLATTGLISRCWLT